MQKETQKEEKEMKVPKNVSLKTLAVTVLIAVLASGFIFYVLAPTPTATFWISPGVYPNASYTVWREGSNYFGKNQFGEIVYSNTTFSEVLQDSYDALTSGGKITLVQGSYSLSAQVNFTINQNIFIEGYGAIIAPSNDNIICFYIEQASSLETRGATVRGLHFNNSNGQTGVTAIQIDSSYHVLLEDMLIEYFDVGVHFYNNQAGRWSESCGLRDLDFNSCAISVLFEQGAGTSSFAQTSLSNIFMRIPANGHGVLMEFGANVYRSYLTNVQGWMLGNDSCAVFINSTVTGSIFYIQGESSISTPDNITCLWIGGNASFGYHSSNSSQYDLNVDAVGSGWTDRIYNPADVNWRTENGGRIAISHNSDVQHNLTGVPNAVVICKGDMNLDSESFTVHVEYHNSTHFRVGARWNNGTYINSPNTVDIEWYAVQWDNTG